MKQLFQIIFISLVFLNCYPARGKKTVPLLPVAELPQIDLVVVTPTYNNSLYAIGNICSVVCQSYPYWRMIIINDRSLDTTGDIIRAYLDQHALHEKITLINNSERKGALCNIYETVHQLPDEAIVAILDGDDELFDADALRRVVQEYADPAVWMTYGSFCYASNGRRGLGGLFPRKVLQKSSFRKEPWITSHLRTFKAWLFKKIAKDDLLYEGKFYQVAWDLAIMFPMLEMAHNRHIRYISNILYKYNDQNPLNDHRQAPGLQQWCNQRIRSQKKYKGL